MGRVGMSHGIAIVAASREVRNTLGSWFGEAGYEIGVGSTFAEAKKLLSLNPDLVISELKLGEYNGLHVAAHTHELGIPTIVIGPSDILLEHEAEQLGALYLTSVRRQDLLDVVAHELAAHSQGGPEDCRFTLAPRSMMRFPLPGRSFVAN